MAKTTHGAYLWLREGKINPSIRGHRRLQRYLKDLEEGLINDLGGPTKLTAAKEILIKTTIEAYGFILLSSLFCKRTSILRPDKVKRGIMEFQPVLGHQFISFLNACRQNLIALGLDKDKADEVLAPYEIIEKEKKK